MKTGQAILSLIILLILAFVFSITEDIHICLIDIDYLDVNYDDINRDIQIKANYTLTVTGTNCTIQEEGLYYYRGHGESRTRETLCIYNKDDECSSQNITNVGAMIFQIILYFIFWLCVVYCVCVIFSALFGLDFDQ